MLIGTVLLAAGGSTRLSGDLKQLLLHEGQPLVRYVAQTVLSLQAGPVVVVMGAHHERITPVLARLPLQIVYNPNWSAGLASSLTAGLLTLPLADLEAVLILLTDQPHVTTDLLGTLIATRTRSNRGIVACAYGGEVGVPALFDKRYFDELLSLTGDAGAKRILRQHRADCADVPFALGAVDLDTPQDVLNWQSQSASADRF